MRPLVIGHRGFPARYPDNSLAGVAAAIAAGADGVEVDVRPCADGVWVCHHDRTRAGTSVLELPAELLGREGVPTLDEVAATVPADRTLFVEVKPLALEVLARHATSLLAQLRRRKLGVRVISSSTSILEVLLDDLPGVAASWIVDDLPEVVPAGLDLSPKHTLVERVIGLGRPLHPWTVNAAPRMRQLARLGVASITTNRPDLAIEVLRG